MDIKSTLQAARDLITDPKAWIKGDYARSEQGLTLYSPSHPDAACFCAIGALARASGMSAGQVEQSDLAAALNLAMGRIPQASVANLNDSSTHEEILAIFDRAIEVFG